MATSFRRAACCGVHPNVVHGYTAIWQERCERPSSYAFVAAGRKGATQHKAVPCRLWGASVKLWEGHKDEEQLNLRPGSVGPARCQKMFVPGFGEKSPEAKAAESLHNFFTFLAVKIVLSQLQDYNKEAYAELMDFVDRVSLKDGDKFCATLMRETFRHKNLALRIMEVRSAYANHDFEWDNLKSLCHKHMEDSNTRLMREFLVETSNLE